MIGLHIEKDNHFLIVVLHGQQYGIRAELVQHIVPLPPLSLAQEYPLSVAGMVYWRGTAVPAIDLSYRLGRGFHQFAITDELIILECRSSLFAFIVNKTTDMLSVPNHKIEDVPSIYQGDNFRPAFLNKVFYSGDGLVFILDIDQLIAKDGPGDKTASFLRQPFEENWNEDQLTIFQDRAQMLNQVEKAVSHEERPHAVIAISGEYYCFDLLLVLEFSYIHRLIPIPCTPSHVAGAVKLRGKVFTVLDLGAILGLSKSSEAELEKMVLVRVDDMVVGLMAEQIDSIVQINPQEVIRPPAALRGGGRGAYSWSSSIR